MRWTILFVAVVVVLVSVLVSYSKDVEGDCEAIGGVPVREYYGGIVCIDKDVILDD